MVMPMNIGNMIRIHREKLNISQEALAKQLNVSQQAVDRWENGGVVPRNKSIEKMLKLFNISRNELFCETPSANYSSQGVKIPILGSVVAGIPVSAITDILGYEEITQQMAHNGKHFALRVKGDSMLPDLKEGDIVIVREQPDVESGSVAIVLINGDEATVKQVKKSKDGIVLFGYNTAVYEPHFYTNKEIEELPIQIIGKVVESRREW